MSKTLIKLKFDPRKAGARRRRCFGLLGLFFAVLVGGLASEQWRGQWQFERWKTAMAERGATLDPVRLWPAPSVKGEQFSNRLARVVASLPPQLKSHAGTLQAMCQTRETVFHRGSQAPVPECSTREKATLTWEQLDDLLMTAEPSLSELRDLLRDPPGDGGYAIQALLEDAAVPNLVRIRVSAQVLHAATLAALHRQDLPGALQNLEALSACVRVSHNDPNLGHYMIRVAILGLTIDTYWDALQAEGWSSEQVAAMQNACGDTGALLEKLPSTMEALITSHLYNLQWFQDHSYNDWVRRYEDLYKSFGMQPRPEDIRLPVRLWRDWVFHRLWSFAWADLEKLHYLQTIEPDLQAIRFASQNKSWSLLRQQLEANRVDYHSPPVPWRFYLSLPLLDRSQEIVAAPGPQAQPKTSASGGFQILLGGRDTENCPYPDHSRAWLVAMRNLTLHQMLMTGLALKRYKLDHGHFPAELKDLIPQYLAQMPRDFMDGQALRYDLKTPETYTLYSIGENETDDGGNTSPAQASTLDFAARPWSGRDWVWPHAGEVPATEALASASPQ